MQEKDKFFMGSALKQIMKLILCSCALYSCVFGKRNYKVLVRVCVCVCLCVCVCFCTITQKEINLGTRKLEYIVVYENSWDKFDIELHRTKVKVTVGVQNYLPQYKLVM